MLKKFYLPLALATAPLITATNLTKQPVATPTNTSANTKNERINAAKQSLALEIQTMLAISNKALSAQKEVLKDGFDELYQRVMKIVHQVLNLPEFTQAVENMTELQKNSILFDTQINEEDFTNLALVSKVNEALAQEFPSLDEQTEKLFNIMYVTIANILANKQLLNKLDAETKNLTATTKDQ